MLKMRGFAYCLVMALSQPLPAPAWAQAQTPGPPAPDLNQPHPDIFPVGRESGQGVDLGIPNYGPNGIGFGELGYPAGTPRASLLPQTRTPVTLNPPKEWQGKDVRLSARLREDGSVDDVKVLSSSGVEALDMAAMAHAKQFWHGAPPAPGATNPSVETMIRFPVVRCKKGGNIGWTPGLPLALAKDNPIPPSFNVTIAPDGRIADVALFHSSGDAAFDAAVAAHIRQMWRFGAFPEGCAGFTARFGVAIPSRKCSPQPLPESRTVPEIGPGDRPGALLLQIGVNMDGKVQFTNVIESSGNPGLDAVTVARVKEAWRWLPASCNAVRPENNYGRATVATDLVRVEFSRPPS
jgi:TonB family protein